MPYQFEMKEEENGVPFFQCPLKHYRCSHINAKTGIQCGRKQYIGFDLCFQHLVTDCNLKIKKSNMEGAGKGLFAYNGTKNNDIIFKGNQSKGDRIIAYNADVITHLEANRRYGNHTAPYGVYVNKDYIEDAACMRSAGSLANHISHSKANAKLYSHQGRVYLRAIKNIRNGDEILTDYGKEYIMKEKGVNSITKYIRNGEVVKK